LGSPIADIQLWLLPSPRGPESETGVPLSAAIAIPVHGKCELAHIAVSAGTCHMVGNRPPGTRVEMKKLLATIALLCLSSTVLAHDIYSNLRDRAGHPCCNGQDCKPVQATVLPDGSYYLPGSDEIIPADMATPSPDDRFHHCIYYPITNQFDPNGPVWVSKPKTRCFFVPMNSS
jgi:hypothetical protein